MEGRMMLSASGLDVSPPALDITQFTVKPLEFHLGAEYVSLIRQPIDGGYINSDAVFTKYNSFGGEANSANTAAVDQHGTSVAGISQLYGVAGQDINVVPLWQFTTPYESDGLQPAVIVSQTNGTGALAPDLKPVVLGPSPSAPGGSEGGSIPIHAIFADFRKDSQLASGVKAVATPAIESSIESLTAARQLPTPDNALPGEWARAMVFEIAGGEPTASDLHSLGGQDGKTSDSDALQNAEPLSSVGTSHQNLKLASAQHAAGSQAGGTSAAEMSQAQAEQQSRQLATVVMQLLDSSKLAAGFSAPLSASQFAAGNLLITENPDPTAIASAAVFDQLGQDNAAVIESSVEGKSWLRSIGMSPFLMVLALERIAALNSRRAARETRISAAKKPPRLRS
jgi:hypothetical protein